MERETKTLKCIICHKLFESEGLKSCPAHSFGETYEDHEWAALDDGDYLIATN